MDVTAAEAWLATPALLALMSVVANARLKRSESLPMQFGFDGRPIWSAPRWTALAFIPAVCFFVMIVLAAVLPGRPTVVPFVAGIFTAAHAFYLALLFIYDRQ